MVASFGVQRSILYDLKDEIVPPTNETVAQVFARLSAYRDAMDGPQVTANVLPAKLLCLARLSDTVAILSATLLCLARVQNIRYMYCMPTWYAYLDCEIHSGCTECQIGKLSYTATVAQ